MSVYLTHRLRDPLSDVSIADFLEIRPRCEVRGAHCLGRASQRHHALYRRDRRYPELNVLLNYQAVCEHCHTGTGEADSTQNKYDFYERQIERYGREVVDGWIESLPLQCKDF